MKLNPQRRSNYLLHSSIDTCGSVSITILHPIWSIYNIRFPIHPIIKVDATRTKTKGKNCQTTRFIESRPPFLTNYLDKTAHTRKEISPKLPHKSIFRVHNTMYCNRFEAIWIKLNYFKLKLKLASSSQASSSKKIQLFRQNKKPWRWYNVRWENYRQICAFEFLIRANLSSLI